jgi:hypothetical protein
MHEMLVIGTVYLVDSILMLETCAARRAAVRRAERDEVATENMILDMLAKKNVRRGWAQPLYDSSM